MSFSILSSDPKKEEEIENILAPFFSLDLKNINEDGYNYEILKGEVKINRNGNFCFWLDSDHILDYVLEKGLNFAKLARFIKKNNKQINGKVLWELMLANLKIKIIKHNMED